MTDSSNPTTESARDRLRQAQRAESDALAQVEAIMRRRQRIAGQLDAVDAELATARAKVVTTSGLERAALLLDVPTSTLRRVRRHGGATSAPFGGEAHVRSIV